MKKSSLCNVIILSALLMITTYFSALNYGMSIAFFIIASPIVAYITYTYGIFDGILSSLANIIFNTAVAFCINEHSMALFFTISLLICCSGFLCGICFKNKFSIKDTVLYNSSLFAVFSVLAFAFVKYYLKIDINKEISYALETKLLPIFNLYKSVYPDIMSKISIDINELISYLELSVPGLLPCVVVILCLTVSIVIIIIARDICKKVFIRKSDFMQGFDCIIISKATMLVLLGIIILSTSSDELIVQMLAANIITVILFMYFIAGISFLEYKLKQENLNAFIRIVIILLAIFALTIISALIPIVNFVFVFVLIGIADSNYDFRKINCKEDFDEN